MSTTLHGQRPRRTARPLALAAAMLLAAAGCQQEVTKPDIITPDNLAGKDALPTIRAAALGDFSLAYSGSGADGSSGTEGIIMAGGLLADEFINSETFPTRIEVDRRSIQTTNSSVTGWFRTLMRARRSVEFAADKYRALAPDTLKEAGFSEMQSLAGFMYVFFAENYCSGVPVSTALDDGSLVFGPPLTTANLLDSAVVRFTHARGIALVLDTSTTTLKNLRNSMLNLATVGLARAQLDQATTTAQIQAAAATVAAVPTTFVYSIGHSLNTTRQNNGVFVAMQVAKRYSVANGEGTNGLTFRIPADSRIPTSQAGNGFDNATPQFNQGRFIDRNTANPLATGAEARLIEAESFLAQGDTVNWLVRLNGLRTTPPSYFAPPGGAVTALAALTSVGLVTVTAQNLMFREREFWLWLSAHRLGDLRRMTHAPYSRGGETVFPTGNYFKGGVYGTDYNFPVPFDETNNPNFTQCIDRNP